MILCKNILPSAHDSSLPLVAPTLTSAYNMAYLATANASAQISLRETSDTLVTLSEMPASEV